MYRLLSFNLSITTPTFGQPLTIEVDESVELGNVDNTS